VKVDELQTDLTQLKIPPVAARIIAKTLITPKEVSNELIQYCKNNVFVIKNLFYLRSSNGKITMDTSYANLIPLGFVFLKNDKDEKFFCGKNGSEYLIALSNIHVFTAIHKNKFRLLSETELYDKDQKNVLKVKWDIPKQNGDALSMIFINKYSNIDVCILLISSNNTTQLQWNSLKESLKKYTNLEELYESNFRYYHDIDKNDDIKVNELHVEQRSYVKKNQRVIVVGQKLYGNNTCELVSGIGEVVHVPSNCEFIVNLPGLPCLSSGCIFGFDTDQQNAYLIGIVRSSTEPKVISAISFETIHGLITKPWEHFPIELLKCGNVTKGSVEDFSEAYQRFIYLNSKYHSVDTTGYELMYNYPGQDDDDFNDVETNYVTDETMKPNMQLW